MKIFIFLLGLCIGFITDFCVYKHNTIWMVPRMYCPNGFTIHGDNTMTCTEEK